MGRGFFGAVAGGNAGRMELWIGSASAPSYPVLIGRWLGSPDEVNTRYAQLAALQKK
jgi:hypothetical protein